MHGLVGHEFFQQRCRALPGDAFDGEKTDIEPGDQQNFEVAVKGGEFRLRRAEGQQVSTQIDQEFDALGEGIKLAEQPLLGRNQCFTQPVCGLVETLVIDRCQQVFSRGLDLFPVDVKIVYQGFEEVPASCLAQGQVEFTENCGPLAGRDFAATTVQTVFHQELDPGCIGGWQVGIHPGQVVPVGAEDVAPGPPDMTPIELKT